MMTDEIFVALLRGINVGGHNKINMQALKQSFARAGMESVVSYINTGNIIFVSKAKHKTEISGILEKAILKDFDLSIKVLLRNFNDYQRVMKSLPKNWKNDAEMKCDVLFLWDEVDRSSIVKEFAPKPGIDTVKYIPGAVLWKVDRPNVTKSAQMKIATKLYQRTTIRNVNTARKIFALMQELSDQM